MSPARVLPSRAQAILICATAVLTALACAGLCAAAMLVPAPAYVVPLVAGGCIGLPIAAAWRVPHACTSLRRDTVVAAFRHGLARLPETEHPLGL